MGSRVEERRGELRGFQRAQCLPSSRSSTLKKRLINRSLIGWRGHAHPFTDVGQACRTPADWWESEVKTFSITGLVPWLSERSWVTPTEQSSVSHIVRLRKRKDKGTALFCKSKWQISPNHGGERCYHALWIWEEMAVEYCLFDLFTARNIFPITLDFSYYLYKNVNYCC